MLYFIIARATHQRYLTLIKARTIFQGRKLPYIELVILNGIIIGLTIHHNFDQNNVYKMGYDVRACIFSKKLIQQNVHAEMRVRAI